MKRTSLVLLFSLVLLVVFNLVIHKGTVGVRWDLTENKLYTLSEGSRAILGSLEKEIELNLYFSEEPTKDLPALRAYARRVQELLFEFESLSKGKIKVNVVDPKPFSEEEDTATLAGLQAIPVGVSGDNLFFGLVGKVKGEEASAENEADDKDLTATKEEIISFFQPDKEQFLEYSLSQLVFNLNREKAPMVGIMTDLQVNGGMDMMRRTQTPAWVFMQFVEDLFEVEWVQTDSKEIPKDVDVLLVIHPKGLGDETLLAIDQFALGGGRILAFVDPFAEQDQPMPMMMGGPHDSSSDLGPLLEAWGVKLRDSAVLADMANSMVVGVGPTREPARHLGLLGLSQDAWADQDIILSGLESINVSSVGILDKVESATASVQPLIYSSKESNALESAKFQNLANPKSLMEGFSVSGEQYILAARMEGQAATAFPDGITIEEEVELEEDAEQDKSDTEAASDDAGEEEKKTKTVTKTISPELTTTDSLNVVVVADTDILSDRLWVQVQQFFGQSIASPWANNGDFLVNALDNLSGNADLINIRSRGRFARPFEVVDELRLEAEEKFADQQDELQKQLEETETKLAEMQQLRQGDDNALLSPEQEQALLEFQEEKLKIRKALREVQRSLDQEIESLGARLKLINIGLIPIVLTVIALLGVFIRRKQRTV